METTDERTATQKYQRQLSAYEVGLTVSNSSVVIQLGEKPEKEDTKDMSSGKLSWFPEVNQSLKWQIWLPSLSFSRQDPERDYQGDIRRERHHAKW